VDKLIALLEQTAAERGGRVEKTEKWGNRKLAYRVQRYREGYYVYLVVRGTQGGMIQEMERRLKVADPVIKYLTVRLDEELKRQRKLAHRRERRAARRSRKSGSAAAAEQAAS
jgi:small subunit ribosomal protein S6